MRVNGKEVTVKSGDNLVHILIDGKIAITTYNCNPSHHVNVAKYKAWIAVIDLINLNTHIPESLSPTTGLSLANLIKERGDKRVYTKYEVFKNMMGIYPDIKCSMPDVDIVGVDIGIAISYKIYNFAPHKFSPDHDFSDIIDTVYIPSSGVNYRYRISSIDKCGVSSLRVKLWSKEYYHDISPYQNAEIYKPEFVRGLGCLYDLAAPCFEDNNETIEQEILKKFQVNNADELKSMLDKIN